MNKKNLTLAALVLAGALLGVAVKGYRQGSMAVANAEGN